MINIKDYLSLSFLVAIFLLLLIKSGFAQSDLREEIQQITAAEDVMGLVAKAWCGDQVEHIYLGMRDIDRQLSINADTKFRIASISKLTTAIAALYLVQEGMIDLDKDVSEYLDFQLRNPRFPQDEITMRMLLSHTSSLQDGSGYNNFLSATASENPPPISSYLLADGTYYNISHWRTEHPGSYFMYSNAGYGLIATVIEAVTETRFDQFMYETILPALEIPGSYNVSDLDDISNLAVLYRKTGANWVPQFDNFQGESPSPRPLPNYTPGQNGMIFSPQGGLRTNTEGLRKIGEVLLGTNVAFENGFLKPETREFLSKAEWIYDGENGDNYFGLMFQFGLGSHITRGVPGYDMVIQNREMIGHPGSAYGLLSDLYVDPENNFGLVFITNGVGEGFKVDNRSAFYTIEQDVFEALSGIQAELCQTDTNAEQFEPNSFRLTGNYPNPFNAQTIITFELEESTEIKLEIFDNVGNRVAILFDGTKSAGEHQVGFDAKKLASGVYIVRLSSLHSSHSKKITLLR